MGLIDLKTNLKTLKYGNDQKGGGSSNQPYIVAPIPDGYTENASDFLLRNGCLNLVSSEQDVSRLTKLFKDTKSPNGLQFIAKQELLERQNVEVPGGLGRIYNPLNTLAQAGVTSIGYHLNKQGLDPFARGYFNGGSSGYYRTTLRDNDLDINRLYGLYKIKQINSRSNQPENFLLSSTYNISSNPNYLFSYSGGPGSVLGIGNTNIRVIGNGYGNPLERTNNEVVTKDALEIFKRFDPTSSETILPTVDIERAGKRGSTTLNSLNNTYNPYMSRVGIGTPGNFNREDTYQTSYTEYRSIPPKTNPNNFYAVDEINASRILTSGSIEDYKNSDLVKFYFEIINNNTVDNIDNSFLFFRAYINNLGDGFKADWQSYKYVGRAENFYKYAGFSRDISLSFTIYAHSRAEMLPIYQKLNYLVGVTAPSYSDAGLMRGNFIRMTIGDYLLDVPGIVQNINLKPSFEAGWDLNRKEDGSPFKLEDDSPDGDEFVGQLPRMIEVDLSFTPIHNFTPQIKENFIRNI